MPMNTLDPPKVPILIRMCIFQCFSVSFIRPRIDGFFISVVQQHFFAVLPL